MVDLNEAIVDASVIVAAVLEEHGPARKLLYRGGKYFVIDTTLTEVANVLKFKTKNAQETRKALDKIFKMHLEPIRAFPYDLTLAFDIAIKTDTTVYDALYHAVAITADYTFFTLDKEYWDKANHLGNISLLT